MYVQRPAVSHSCPVFTRAGTGNVHTRALCWSWIISGFRSTLQLEGLKGQSILLSDISDVSTNCATDCF